MTPKIYFSVIKEYAEKIRKIAEEKTKDRTFSVFISKAIVEKYERDNTKKIDDFQTPSLELDFLPKINEMLTRDVLKQLGEKDLVRTYKMMHYNLSVMKQYLDSHEDRRVLLDK